MLRGENVLPRCTGADEEEHDDDDDDDDVVAEEANMAQGVLPVG